MAEVLPAGTVTEAATGSRPLLLERATEVVPEVAPLRVTVQVVLPEMVIVEGVQDRELRDGAAPPPVTVPPETESGIALPCAEAAVALVIPIGTLIAPAAMVRFTTTTAPLEIMAALKPETRQL